MINISLIKSENCLHPQHSTVLRLANRPNFNSWHTMGSLATAAPASNKATVFHLPARQQVGLIQQKTVGAALPAPFNSDTAGGMPKLFTPFKIRGLEFPNRIFVSPLCMYSCEDQDGVFSDFHLAHYGTLAMRGPGLVMIEATVVTPNGRLSPQDTGLYNEGQKESLRRIVNLAHASSGRIGIQIAHGGRKASTYAPFHNFEESGGQMGRGIVPEAEGGFPNQLVAPSPLAWKAGFPTPKELTMVEIREMVAAWAHSAKLAVEAGIDVIEIHGAHGYLIHEFLSGNVNQRTDEYGGTPENRRRFLIEIIKAIRAVIPTTMPLFLRVSGTDFVGGDDLLHHDPRGWDIWQVIELCKVIAPLAVDLIDVSSGGIVSSPRVKMGIFAPEFGFQPPLAEQVKKAAIPGLLVASVGSLHDGKFAEQALKDGKADIVFVGRQFLKDPTLVQTMADELQFRVRWPAQYSWMWQQPWLRGEN